MADNLGTLKLFCQGGLNTSRDALSQGETSPGSAISMINYEPAVTGGYRRISGYSNDYGTVPGTGPVLGVFVANGINDGILAAREPSSGNDYLHYWDNATSAWVAVTTSGSPTMSGVSKIRYTRYNFSGDSIVLTDGINPAATYDGTTYTQITHATAPSAPRLSSVFKSHLFLAGDPAEPTNLYFSAPINVTDFSPANGAGVINVGFPIVALKVFRDTLYIFGTNSIKKLEGNNISNFLVDSVTDDLGCVATDSVIELGGDLLFLSQDGLRPIGGTSRIGDVNLETVSKDIQSIVSDFSLGLDLEGINAVVVRQKTQFRLLFSSSGSQGVIGGIRNSQQGMVFEFGQLLGIEATSATSGYVGQNEHVIHGDSSGKVHRQERGTSFDGADIFSLYQTPFLHMQDPEQRKLIHSVCTYMRSEGDNNLTMSVVYDYEDFNSLTPSNYNIISQGAAAYYSSALYNSTAVFSGNPSPVTCVNVSGSGKSVSFKFVTNDDNASHSIQGLTVTYGVGDRR